MPVTHLPAVLPLLLAALPLYSQTKPPIDTEQARVTIAVGEPHRKSALHEHSLNRVMVYLDAGTDRFTAEDGRVEDRKFASGDARWSPAGGRHTNQSTGANPYRVVEVELKNRGRVVTPGALDPVKLAPAGYRVLMDKLQVRVLGIRIGPNEKVPFHEHGLNRVVVYLSDAHLRVTEEGGKTAESSARAGEVRLSGPGRHSEENLAGAPFEAVVVELK